jgi:hypothetical protein
MKGVSAGVDTETRLSPPVTGVTSKNGLTTYPCDLLPNRNHSFSVRRRCAFMGSRSTCLSSPLEHRVEFLSSLDGNAALLDGRGTIVAVNQEWTHFGSEHGVQRGSIGVGLSYIEVCRNSGDADAALKGLLSILNGDALVFRCEYRCDGPQTLQWFLLTVTPWQAPEGGVLVHHRNISEYEIPEEIQSRTLKHARAIIWAADAPSFRTSFLSGQVEEILGFPTEAWLEDPDLWKKQLHPEDRA